MSETYYDLLALTRGAPNWKLTKDLYAVIEELKEAYGDELPKEFEVPLSTLGNPGERDRYDSFLEWAEEGSPVDFGEHTDRLSRLAETVHHFRVIRCDGGKVALQNLGVPEPPAPPLPTALAPSNTVPPDLLLVERVTPGENEVFFESYYEALGLEPFCDEALIEPALQAKLENDWAPSFGSLERMPEVLTRLVATFHDAQHFRIYRQLLRQSENGEPFAHDGRVKELDAMAQNFHFEFKPYSLKYGIFRNPGFVVPKPVPPPRAVHTPVAPRQATGGQDGYGRVDGRIPPLVIGPHVYHVEYAPDLYLESAINLRDSIQYDFVQDLGERGVNRVSRRNFIGNIWEYCTHPGATYFALNLRDPRNNRTYESAYCCSTIESSAITIYTSFGLFGLFPWHAKYLRGGVYWDDAQYLWTRDHPNWPCPPCEYFSVNPWDKQTSNAFARYAEEVGYWVRARLSGFNGNPERARYLAKTDASAMLRTFMRYSPRKLRKLGYPVV